MNENQIIGYNPQTGQPIYATQQYSYSGVMKRLVAYLIDSLMIWVIIFLFFMILAMVQMGIRSNTLAGLQITISMLLALFGQPIYSIMAESGKKHRTLGKRLMHIVVKNEDGSYLNFTQSLLRNILKVIIPFNALISFILIITTEKKQALHDNITKQIVVKEM